MHNILYIGKPSQISLFNRSEHALHCKPNISQALQAVSSTDFDLIFIDPGLCKKVSSSANFRRNTAKIPRLFCIDDKACSLENIIKAPLDFPIYLPCTPDALSAWITKIKEIRVVMAKETARKESLDKEKQHAEFLDLIMSSFHNQEGLMKSFLPVMNTLKGLTDAAAWSVLLTNDPACGLVKMPRSKHITQFIPSKKKSIAGKVIEYGAALNVADAKKDSFYNSDIDLHHAAEAFSLACAPLIISERTVGVLRLHGKKESKGFSDSALSLFKKASILISLHIDRNHLSEDNKNDDLTGLYNIRYLHKAAEVEIERARRSGQKVSVIFMDLDELKAVNDRFGHLVGSQVLIEVADILRTNLRKIDIITRYCGDEFVAILPQTPLDVCFKVAERIRKVIEKRKFLARSGYNVGITASLGIASYPENASIKDDLLQMADAAMYRSKFKNKNSVVAAE